jgi:hypothetical protein
MLHRTCRLRPRCTRSSNLSRAVLAGYGACFLLGGHVGILIGVYALFSALGGAPRKRWDQAAIFAIVCIYPSVIVSGTIIPEDKQYETALCLFGAALLFMTGGRGRTRDIAAGLTVSLSILFKLFGIFLLPLFLIRTWKHGFRSFLGASIAGLVPLALSFALFGFHLIETGSVRVGNDNFGVPQQSSPWTLLAALGNSNVQGLRTLCTIGLIAGTMWLFARRRIDLLNACAALMVVFGCVWLVSANINRMNIAMMFALPAMASVSVKAFRITVFANLAVQAIGYPVLYTVMGRDLAPVQAVLTSAFLAIYFYILFQVRRDTAEHALGGPLSSSASNSEA